MYLIELNGKKYNIYTSLKDITVAKYCACIETFKGKNFSDINARRDLLFFLSDMPEKFKEYFPTTYIDPLFGYVQMLLDSPTDNVEHIEQFTYGAVTYKAAPARLYPDGEVWPMKDCTVEQYIAAADVAGKIDVSSATDRFEKLPQILSFLFTPDGKDYNDHTAGESAQKFRSMPMADALAAFQYFLLTDAFIHQKFKPLFTGRSKNNQARQYGKEMAHWGWYAFIADISADLKSIENNYKSNIYEFLQLALYKKQQDAAITKIQGV